MRKLFLASFVLLAFLLLGAPAVKAGNFQLQVSNGGFFQQQVLLVPTNRVFLASDFDCGGGRQQVQLQQGGFFRRSGQQIQQSGGNSLQINQQRGFFGRIRGQQIQSSGPGGNFQLNQR